MSLDIGGSLLNVTLRVDRDVDAFDGCMGNACGGKAAIGTSRGSSRARSLTIITGGDITNLGGSIGAVTDATLAAGGDIRMETLLDSFLVKDFHKHGFFSSTDIVESAITTPQARPCSRCWAT